MKYGYISTDLRKEKGACKSLFIFLVLVRKIYVALYECKLWSQPPLSSCLWPPNGNNSSQFWTYLQKFIMNCIYLNPCSTCGHHKHTNKSVPIQMNILEIFARYLFRWRKGALRTIQNFMHHTLKQKSSSSDYYFYHFNIDQKFPWWLFFFFNSGVL